MIDTSTFEDVLCIRATSTFLGRPLMWAYAYLLDGVLIDSCHSNVEKEFLETLKDHIPNLKAVIATHPDEDHIGNNLAIQKINDKIWFGVHSSALTRVQNPPKLGWFLKLYWGEPEPFIAEPLPEIIETKNNEYQFEVIYTPGHDPSHVSFWEPKKRWLFTGDAIPLGKNKKESTNEENLNDIVRTLYKILNLNPKVIFDSHRRPIEEDKTQDYLKIRITNLRDLISRILELHEQGVPQKKITQTLLGRERLLVRYGTRGRVRKLYAVTSVLSQLVNQEK